ncbi:hypothetical protein Ancab_030590 [Ancistrocladus abbreviatus]
MGEEEKPVILVGMDDSEYSSHALERTLDRFFVPFGSNHPFKLIIIHAKPPVMSFMAMGPGGGNLLPVTDCYLKRTATSVLEKARELCRSRSVGNVHEVVIEGDARTVLCEAVDKYHASILVVGSHGYNAITRAVLGSVSDYCAHNADCSVMIIKKPRNKR